MYSTSYHTVTLRQSFLRSIRNGEQASVWPTHEKTGQKQGLVSSLGDSFSHFSYPFFYRADGTGAYQRIVMARLSDGTDEVCWLVGRVIVIVFIDVGDAPLLATRSQLPPYGLLHSRYGHLSSRLYVALRWHRYVFGSTPFGIRRMPKYGGPIFGRIRTNFFPTGTRVALAVTATGWTAEFFIPWSLIGYTVCILLLMLLLCCCCCCSLTYFQFKLSTNGQMPFDLEIIASNALGTLHYNTIPLQQQRHNNYFDAH